VDDLGVRGECGEAARDAVVEADAEGDDEIALRHGHVGGVATVHAGHGDEIGVTTREAAEAHKGAHGGKVGHLDELAKLGGCGGRDDPSAGIDERALGLGDHLGGAADLAGVTFGKDFVAGQMDRGHRRVVSLGLEDVLGDVDQDGSGAAGGSDVESFVDDLRQIADVLDEVVVLGAGAGDAEGIGFLECVASDQLGVDLSCECDDRDRIHHGVNEAGDEVGGARSGGGTADADASGGTRVAGGGERGVLLMPYEDMTDRVIVDGIIERESDSSRVAEEAIDAFANEAFQQHASAAHQTRHGHHPFIDRRTAAPMAASRSAPVSATNKKGH
jgi:hypothetical protein